MIGRLHFLTDTQFQKRFQADELVRFAMRGGVDTIQFRQKTGTSREKLSKLKAVQQACTEFGVPLIVDDHLDLALAVEANGVHLGQTDLPVEIARQIVQSREKPFVIGATVTTTQLAIDAEQAGADYLGFGPVFETSSKENPASVKGIDGLRNACGAVSIPVIAIAGITVDRVPSVIEAGAHGVAVMTAISTAKAPEASARAFVTALG